MSRIWWLWLPAAFIIIQIGLEIILPQDVLAVLHSENGPHELLQFLIMAAGCAAALRMLANKGVRAQKWLAAWVGLAALCCLYVAGEEISWGQHFLDWTTPEFWTAVNDQAETNLHNTSSWLDQKPRLMLEIGILTGGIIIPLLRRYKQAWVPERFSIIYPPASLMVVAILALGIKIADKTAEAMGLVLFERGSEVEELYLFYFVLLYLLVLKLRISPNA